MRDAVRVDERGEGAAVAPLESVSQPPDTARQTERVKSPSAWVRAAAIRAVLGTAWTQW